jgi:PAS domain S-box-containing protein
VLKPVFIIASHAKIYELAQKVAGDFDDVEVAFGLLDEAVPIALKAEQEGAQVIISRGGTTRLIENSDVTIPVVDIAVSPYNLLMAIHRAQAFDRRVTVMGFFRIIKGVEKLGSILNVELEVQEIANRKDAEDYVHERMKSPNPIRVLLGGAIAERLAGEYQLPTVFLETSQEDIENAVGEAYKLLEVRRRQAQKTEQFKAILENINHGVIAVDQHGLITTFNQAAGKITGISQLETEGKMLGEVFAQGALGGVIETGRPRLGELISIGRTMALSNQVPVRVGREIVGAVETLEDVTKIQEYENIIRLKMAEKGHLARFCFDDVLGESGPFRKTKALAQKYAAVDSTILIEGESGTGKEVFAQSVHCASSRAKGPFVAVNCGAIPETLLESELFGYQSGAFTGARRGGKDGLFTLAHSGTIFLDEISETSSNFQATLLRVIQEMEVRPLGSDRVIPIDVRIIASTNRDMKQEVEHGRFRRDLYYRLNILRLAIPPLRERREDVRPLVRHFMGRHAAKLGKPISINKSAMAALCGYDWPGNIRELQNIIERLCVNCDGHIGPALVSEALDSFSAKRGGLIPRSLLRLDFNTPATYNREQAVRNRALGESALPQSAGLWQNFRNTP